MKYCLLSLNCNFFGQSWLEILSEYYVQKLTLYITLQIMILWGHHILLMHLAIESVHGSWVACVSQSSGDCIQMLYSCPKFIWSNNSDRILLQPHLGAHQGCHISQEIQNVCLFPGRWEILGNTGKYESSYYKMLEVDQIRYWNTFRQVSVVLLRPLKTISFMNLNTIFRLKIQF